MESDLRSPAARARALHPRRFYRVAPWLLLVLLPACGGSQDKKLGSGADDATVVAPEPLPPPPPPLEPLDYLPAKTKMVLGFNLSKVADARVLEKYREKLVEQMPREARDALAACNFDPFEDISSLTVGLDHDEKGVLVASGTFDRERFDDCVVKEAETDGRRLTIKEDGELRVYESDDETLYAYWPADDAVVLSTTKMGGAEVITGVLDGAVLADGELLSIVEATDRRAGVWAAGLIDPSVTGGMPVADDLEAFVITADASDAVDVSVLIHFASDEAATQAHSQVTALVPMAKGNIPRELHPLVDKLVLRVSGNSVEVSINLTGADLDSLAEAAR